MSLGGLALGVGMLVDNSIVVLESVQRYRDRGMGVLESARLGASEVGKAVIAATMTTICVFLPIVFVEGVAGQLFRDQALTVTYSLVASLVVALLLIPMLSSLSLEGMLARSEDGTPRHHVRGPALLVRVVRSLARAVGRVCALLLFPVTWTFGAFFALLSRVYPVVLGWSLRHRLVVLAAAVALAAGILSQVHTLGLELIPEMSQGEFLVDLEWRAGQPLEQTTRRVALIDGPVGALPGVELVFALVGASGQTGGKRR
ncbi:efflux RND transporter permease subunit, partial [Candidatus Latescibacterota bacterium]